MKQKNFSNWKLDHLYYCKKCNRVYKLLFEHGKYYVMYMHDEFPKMQDKNICMRCKNQNVEIYYL